MHLEEGAVVQPPDRDVCEGDHAGRAGGLEQQRSVSKDPAGRLADLDDIALHLLGTHALLTAAKARACW